MSPKKRRTPRQRTTNTKRPDFVLRRDTNGWRMQVWTSFALSVCACAPGVLRLPSQELDRAFLAIGFFFCLFTTSAVSRTIRGNRDGQIDNSA